MNKSLIAMPMILLIAGCEEPGPQAESASIADSNLSPATSNTSGPFDPRDTEHGGPWTVQIPGGVLRIGVDTVGSSGPYEQTLGDVTAMMEDPSDGADDYEIELVSSSQQKFAVKWKVEGENPQPIGPRDLGQITKGRPEQTGQFPSGIIENSRSPTGQIVLWAPQDRVAEPCEHFRVSLFDAATGKPLLAGDGSPVIAHGVVRPKFDPAYPELEECAS